MHQCIYALKNNTSLIFSIGLLWFVERARDLPSNSSNTKISSRYVIYCTSGTIDVIHCTSGKIEVINLRIVYTSRRHIDNNTTAVEFFLECSNDYGRFNLILITTAEKLRTHHPLDFMTDNKTLAHFPNTIIYWL